MSVASYLRAHFKWRRSGLITIVTTYDTEIGTFPMTFLQSSGDCNWQYILFVIAQLVDIESDGPGALVSEHEEPVDVQTSPTEGVYRYILICDVTREPKLSRGPEYASRYRKPSLLAESSDRSSSSRTSGRPLQKSFKSMVAARDGVCLLTGRQPPHRLDAAHIVPQSRPDVYRQLLGIRASEDTEAIFDVSAGLLLAPGLHSSFDDLEWSLYRRGDSYIVHYFLPASEDDKRLNGMVIRPDRFRFLDPPDERLVAWHYSQVVKARIRGYSVDMDTITH